MPPRPRGASGGGLSFGESLTTQTGDGEFDLRAGCGGDADGGLRRLGDAERFAEYRNLNWLVFGYVDGVIAPFIKLNDPVAIKRSLKTISLAKWSPLRSAPKGSGEQSPIFWFTGSRVGVGLAALSRISRRMSLLSSCNFENTPQTL